MSHMLLVATCTGPSSRQISHHSFTILTLSNLLPNQLLLSFQFTAFLYLNPNNLSSQWDLHFISPSLSPCPIMFSLPSLNSLGSQETHPPTPASLESVLSSFLPLSHSLVLTGPKSNLGSTPVYQPHTCTQAAQRAGGKHTDLLTRLIWNSWWVSGATQKVHFR